jgi:hypothetical protein
MTRRQARDHHPVLEALVAAILIAAALVARDPNRAGSSTPSRDPQQVTQKAEAEAAVHRNNSVEIAGFRLLVTILAGVALGAAASVLPSLMTTSARGGFLVGIWLLWSTGVIAVILVYLSTLTGSKAIPIEIGFIHTAGLVASFLAQCGLFASLTRPTMQELIRSWFISFSVFGVAATIAIVLGLLLLPKSPRKMDGEALAVYRRGQWTDAVMAALTAIFSAVYVVRTTEPSERSVLLAASIALTSLLAACAKQSVERRRMRRDGLI